MGRVFQHDRSVEPCAAAANLLAPPPLIFVDRSKPFLLCTYFVAIFRSMTNKGHQKIFRIERNFSREPLNKIWRQAAPSADLFGPAARRSRRPKLTGAPPHTQ